MRLYSRFYRDASCIQPVEGCPAEGMLRIRTLPEPDLRVTSVETLRGSKVMVRASVRGPVASVACLSIEASSRPGLPLQRLPLPADGSAAGKAFKLLIAFAQQTAGKLVSRV